ncbi:hypothetical protein D3C86_2035700 [compost metagenome]
MFKERIRTQGGILERIEDNYWPLIYWSIEILAPLNVEPDPVAAEYLAGLIKKAKAEEENRRENMHVPV